MSKAGPQNTHNLAARNTSTNWVLEFALAHVLDYGVGGDKTCIQLLVNQICLMFFNARELIQERGEKFFEFLNFTREAIQYYNRERVPV